MNNTTFRAGVGAALVLGFFGLALAKLPPPPPQTDIQKAEAKAKVDAAADTAKQQQASAEDRVASRYFADMKAKGKDVPPPQMAASAPSAKGPPAPPEKAMAHSPATK